ncbi:MAG: NADPH-dependent F420 reductase [Deltaproteobacteria bacterium]|nr:NADPH-dependent F420 reductase [Deltaproteobacteria bacterium]
MKIAFLGHGNVGGALAHRMQQIGRDVTVGAGDLQSDSVKKLLARSPALKVALPADAVSRAEIVVLATPFQANIEVLTPLKTALAGKILIDCTNPVGPGLSHGLSSKQSGTEMIQQLLPATRVVKAFSIYGFENFEDSSFPGYGVKPVMMFCGNDQTAKAAVSELLKQLGWEPLDVGGVEQALHLEHMTLLWVRMVRMGGHSPRTVWAVLSR